MIICKDPDLMAPTPYNIVGIFLASIEACDVIDVRQPWPQSIIKACLCGVWGSAHNKQITTVHKIEIGAA